MNPAAAEGGVLWQRGEQYNLPACVRCVCVAMAQKKEKEEEDGKVKAKAKAKAGRLEHSSEGVQ